MRTRAFVRWLRTGGSDGGRSPGGENWRAGGDGRGGRGSESWRGVSSALSRSRTTEEALSHLNIGEVLFPAMRDQMYTICLHNAAQNQNGALLGLIATRLSKLAPPLDERVVIALVHACSENGRPEQAATAFRHAELLTGARTTQACYNAMIAALAKHSRIQDALRLVLEMQQGNVERSASSYAPIIEQLARKRRIGEAKEVVKLLDRDRVYHTRRLNTARLFVHNCAGDRRSAEAELQRMIMDGSEVELASFNTVMDVIARERDLAGVRKLFSQMEERLAPDQYSYTTLIRAHFWERDLDGARKVFDQMVGSDVKPALMTYNTMIELCADRGRLADARSYYDQLLASKLEPNPFTASALVQAHVNAGQSEEARKIAAESTTRYAGSLRASPEVAALIKANLVSGREEAAATLLAASSTEDATAYNTALAHHLDRGDMVQFKRVCRMMSDNRVRQNTATYNILIRGCITGGGPAFAGLARGADGA